MGRRIIIVGPSCSGKSTLAETLGARLDMAVIELDALFWKPNWQESGEAEFRERLIEAHAADSWVSAGNYLRHTKDVTWPLADVVIWLDFPLWRTVPRILHRSWARWRARELLWGTNYERFWDQLKVWSPKDSLIAYTVSRRRRNQRAFRELHAESAAAGRTFLRLRSRGEVRLLLEHLAPGERG